MIKQEGIDFVITWVDGSDRAWREEKARYDNSGAVDDNEERYRDWEILNYWSLGLKICALVRKIHFVTWGHLPKWLNTEHPKLNIVRHEDYIRRNIFRFLTLISLRFICIKYRGFGEVCVF